MEQQPTNSFKLLDELAFQEAQDRDSSTEPRPVFGEAPPRILRELQGTFSSYRLMGQLVEVFLPRLVDTMICLTGGRLDDTADPEAPAPPTAEPTPPTTRPTGPLGDPSSPR